jgi:DNA-binding CsgD family transcriptional regulator
MQSRTAVIIHISPIVQQGLKNILLARSIGISDIMNSFPECPVISGWKNTLLFVDTRYAEEFKKHGKIIKKNGNTVFGIGTAMSANQSDLYFDEILNIYDNADIILQKINDYGTVVSDYKSNNQLSAREIEILTKIARGLSNKLIADQLFLSIHTVITHRKNITAKLGIKSISGLTLYAALNNMVDSHS